MPAGTFQYSAVVVNQNLDSYVYSPSALLLQANQELDIRFDPAFYGTLSSPQLPGGFTSILLQPNNPPGTFGDLIITPPTGNPGSNLPVGQFSVDVVSVDGLRFGSQPYFVYQFDANGNYLFTAQAGMTNFIGVTQLAPEPVLFPLVGVALLAGGAWRHFRKRILKVRVDS
jgi:hypothetical protein